MLLIGDYLLLYQFFCDRFFLLSTIGTAIADKLSIDNCLMIKAIALDYLDQIAIIENIVQGKLGMTADIDLRLSRYFGLSEGYFLRLQNAYELMEAKRRLGDSLNQIIPLAI